MAKYQFIESQSGINFNSVDTTLMGVGQKVGNNYNRNATASDLAEIASDNGGKLPTIVNAVEIDWNAAQLDSDTTINTTGEILSPIFAKAA